MTTYMTAAETAKHLRAALKKKFPAVKFSVRSETYSGGASIRIAWIDGPMVYEVEPIASKFEGATFDGMIDLKSHHPIEIDGKEVRTLNDFVFCDREVTLPVYLAAMKEVAEFYGGDFSNVPVRTHESYRFKGVVVAAGVRSDVRVENANEYLGTLVYRALRGSLRTGDAAARRAV